jgi:hypothetical protein
LQAWQGAPDGLVEQGRGRGDRLHAQCGEGRADRDHRGQSRVVGAPRNCDSSARPRSSPGAMRRSPSRKGHRTGSRPRVSRGRRVGLPSGPEQEPDRRASQDPPAVDERQPASGEGLTAWAIVRGVSYFNSRHRRSAASVIGTPSYVALHEPDSP